MVNSSPVSQSATLCGYLAASPVADVSPTAAEEAATRRTAPTVFGHRALNPREQIKLRDRVIGAFTA